MATDLLIDRASPAPTDGHSAIAVDRPLRVWPAVAMLVLFWAFFFGNYWIEMTMFARFMTRLAAYGLLVIGFLGWWLTNRAVRGRDRLLAVAVLVAGVAGVLWLADPSINIWAIFLVASPFVFTAWTAALVVARNLRPAARRTGVSTAILLVLAYYTLIRSDGLDGAQRGEFSWRWSPTSEELFLASRSAAEDGTTNAAEREASAREWTLQPGDWPEFRGVHRDGVVTGIKLVPNWNDQPPRSVWRQRVGPGWSSMIVVDGHLVTQEQRGESEVVACYDAATGQELWIHADAARFFEGLSGAGPRGTPTFSEGRIYALGGNGKLNCLAAATGELLWSHDLVAETGAQVPQWGYSVSPLVVGDRVVVFAGGGDQALLAYDSESGELVWKLAGGMQSYSSPQLVELGGERQLLMHDNRALRSVDLDDGTQSWERATGDEMAMPMLQPHVVGTQQLLVSVERGLSLLEVKRAGGEWIVSEGWFTNRIRPSFSDFVVHDRRVHGLDDGILCCLDVATGERVWKKGRYGHGQILLLADQNALVVQCETGEIALVAIGPERPEELARFQAIDGKTWNHPVLVHDRLYVRNGEEMACYELPIQN